MTSESFTTSFTVDRTPSEVFAAVNDARGWWSGDIEGPTDTLGAEFTYRYQDLHRSRQRVTELVPDTRVVWLVVDADLPFAGNPAEWTGTEIRFDISRVGDATQVVFTHAGLVPDFDCYTDCSGAWSHYVGSSLRAAVTGGKRVPA